MNFLYFINNNLKKIKNKFYIIFFLLIKKPLYIINYNSNGNSFICKGLLINSSINVNGKNNQIFIDKGARLNNMHINVSGNNNRLILHKGVVFSEGGRIKLEDENNLIEIGENTDFVNCFFAVSDYNSKIIVGSGSMFSANIVIRNSDVHSILNKAGKRINHAKDTIIGNHVWVAYGATILKGSHIEDDCIIGSQSVVAGLQMPQGSIAAGNPAKIVKEDIKWDRQRFKE
jgi:acetyltransferase-like isoleucine patch superfamily enzyme